MKNFEFKEYIIYKIIKLINEISFEYEQTLIQINDFSSNSSSILLENGFNYVKKNKIYERIRKKENFEGVEYERNNNCK